MLQLSSCLSQSFFPLKMAPLLVLKIDFGFGKDGHILFVFKCYVLNQRYWVLEGSRC